VFLRIAAALYVIGVISMFSPREEISIAVLPIYCVAALAFGVHCCLNAQRLSEGSRTLLLLFRALPLLLPVAALLVHWIAS
jgi:hypothetical protein